MPHNAAFHQGLHYLLGQNDLQRKKYNLYLENITCDPNIYNGQSKVYCIKPDRRIHLIAHKWLNLIQATLDMKGVTEDHLVGGTLFVDNDYKFIFKLGKCFTNTFSHFSNYYYKL